MILPRWAIAERIRQRRPVKPRPIICDMPADMRLAVFYKSRLSGYYPEDEDNHREAIDKSPRR